LTRGAIAGGGAFTTARRTSHARNAMWLTEQFPAARSSLTQTAGGVAVTVHADAAPA
jgi:RNA 3'-terminal phosphate cyclase